MNGEPKGLSLAPLLGAYQGLGVGTTGTMRTGVTHQDGPPVFWMTMAGPHSHGPDVVGTTVNVFPRGTEAATAI
jgi:hypothetical protein